MKKRLYVCFAAALIAAFVSCAKPEQPKTQDIDEPESAEPFVSTGVVLTRASVWELQADGKLKWARYINAGETVEWPDEGLRKFVNTSNNQENEYYHVYAGGDYWIRDYAVTGPAAPGVILAPETVLYSRPDLGSITTGRNKTIRQYSIVAVHPEMTGDFVEISAYYVLGGQYYVFNNLWVKKENVSIASDDVKGISLYQLALATEDPIVKRELLNNALTVSSSFDDLVEREFTEMAYADRIENIKAQNFRVAEDELNVFDRPDEDAGIVVDYLYRGDTVTAIAKTKEAAAHYDAYWYKIEKPWGWVFGAWLEEAN
ncbi:hypothetical protein FACS1894161_4210 [Spirochaetia bacterium]|nr:hypothetical protein FACS1894161_4210 [Spirochaetia bacterium]